MKHIDVDMRVEMHEECSLWFNCKYFKCSISVAIKQLPFNVNERRRKEQPFKFR